MFRPILSYVLTALILVAQMGLPLHFHYCKGLLESVTLLIKPGCDDHVEVSDLPACCKKQEVSHCNTSKDDCCNDEVLVLTQDLTSLTPHLLKWTDISFVPTSAPYAALQSAQPNRIDQVEIIEKDTGPPRYIRYGALIYYG